MRRIGITDTTLRDAHQSLWATRMEIGDMVPILATMDQVGYWSLEAWGGATFDTCLRFLDENPWERLRTIKQHCPKTPLQMLVRGQNLVGYHHYSDDIVDRFIKVSKRNGMHVFRVFDALNDIRNVEVCARAIKECGGLFEGAISYTISPVHTIDAFLEYAMQLRDLGADTICIKDMAGMLTPFRTAALVEAIKGEVDLPIHLHTHYIGGMAPMNYLKGIEAGAEIIDTAAVALAFGNSQPATEMMVAALKESEFDTGLDLDLLFEIAQYWEDVRETRKYQRGTTSILSMEVFSHQVPGGMMSNLVSQLDIQKSLDRLPDVLEEIPIVRAEVGYPPLVTPMSQIVGTQAVMNVLTGKRWSVVSQEMKDYLKGLYGKAPGPIAQGLREKVLGDDSFLQDDVRPGSLVTATYDQFSAEIGDLAKSEEDVLMYALFPVEARAYLEKHRKDAEGIVFMTGHEASVVREEDTVDVGQIRELMETLSASDIAEITVTEGENTITLRKAGAAPVATVEAPLANTTEAPSIPAAKVGAVAPEKDTYKAITSPMVGTFYASPSPDAGPFVKVGDSVKEGDPLCIVEAMKLMNELSAEEAGTIRQIVVEDGDMVEYGSVLFYYEA
ncbi:MAG: acetyl-CoA carboxylase biotin carboxyl carrier protein [Actinomycetia bacterium]|nr:acetyl-CoA carboxylase biotin carboxyl carrier protein [Actinomycetes bacterium]